MNKKWLVVIFIILVLDVTAGFLVKRTFLYVNSQTISEKIKDRCLFLSGGSFKDCDIKKVSLEEIIKDSDVIVSGRALGDRIYVKSAVLTAFNVERAYKGRVTGSKVYIFEPSYFNLGKYNNFFAYYGYNLMKPGHRYVLFLKKWKYTTFVGYNPYYRGKEIYIFAHNCAIDKFEINGSYITKIINPENNIRYGQVKDFEVFVYNKGELDEYYRLKKKVLNWISKS
ncbi:hypothetical protein [Caldicellulosiruptor morganii]|uniref:Uncharacterized protein n=1 Tax=Caldicellulosiruptor morganii TaxID=1387555 RepID=A0ABY7BQL0_9FIRM|nr:hypothetical protein [Caldicellulosiruptor morganii]WAM34346.1 hypothetical protein OTK00_000530 [Caldicellulosiruptor morganii]